MAMIAVAEISDVNPWQGWTAINTRHDLALRGLVAPPGLVDIGIEAGTLRIARDDV